MVTPPATQRTDVSPDEAPPAAHDEPVADYYETATGLTEPVRERSATPSSDLESVLEQMGAKIVSEHPHTPEGEDG